MRLRSDSFRPWQHLPSRVALGRSDGQGGATFAANRNPHLTFLDVPEGVKSFALWCVDPEAPSVGTDVNVPDRSVPLWLPRAEFFHWAVADLPADLRTIPEASHANGLTPRGKPPGPTPHGGRQGLNDYTGWFQGHSELGGSWAGWDGPFPPWNDERIHVYHFVLAALSVPKLDLPDNFDGRALRAAALPVAIATATVSGLYAICPGAVPARTIV